MGKTTVKLLSREFHISDQLPIFIPIMQKFEQYENQLKLMVIYQAKTGTYTGVSEGDFDFWEKKIRSIAKQVIQDAASNGIFDLTEAELVDDNPGYAELNRVVNETTRQMLVNQIQATLDYLEGADAAYNSAASNITGSGVSIWTSSFGSAMLYSFMEGNVLKKQAKQADKEYDAAIKNLKSTRRFKEKEAEYNAKVNVYYPGCNNAVSQIVTYMFKLYLEAMNNNGKINVTDINSYDLKKSVDIMKNLTVVSPKQRINVLSKAFEWCPYNIDMYYEMINMGHLDQDMADTLEYLTLNNLIAEYYESNIPVFPQSGFTNHIAINKKMISNVCMLKKVGRKDYLYKISDSATYQVKDRYRDIRKAFSFQNARTPFVSGIKNAADIEGDLIAVINSIVNKEDFDCLVNECGHTELLNEIKPDDYTGEISKESIDRYYIDSLLPLYKEDYRRRVEFEQEEKEKRTRKEREEKEWIIQAKALKKKKMIKKSAIAIVVILTISFVIILFVDIIPRHKLNEAKSLIGKGDYLEAVEILDDLNQKKFKNEIYSYKIQCAELLMNENNYEEARNVYISTRGIDEDSDEVRECNYRWACYLYDNTEYEESSKMFSDLWGYKDSEDKYYQSQFQYAMFLYDAENDEEAEKVLKKLGKNADADKELSYREAGKLFDKGDMFNALIEYSDIIDYKDSREIISTNANQVAKSLFEKGDYSKCIGLCNHLGIQNEAYYESNYIFGKEKFEEGKYEDALEYLENCNSFKDDVNDMIDYCQKRKQYIIAVGNANRGDLSVAINQFKELGDFEDSEYWLEECYSAKKISGKYTYDSYTLYYADGHVGEMKAANENMVVKLIKDGDVIKRKLYFQTLYGYVDLTNGRYECNENEVYTLIGETTVKKTLQQYYDDGSEFVLHVIIWSKK